MVVVVVVVVVMVVAGADGVVEWETDAEDLGAVSGEETSRRSRTRCR